MKIKLRDFLRNPGKVKKEIKKGKSVILISREGPFALLLPLNEKGIKAYYLLEEMRKILDEAGISEKEVINIIKSKS